MLELIAGVFALSVVAQVVFWTVVGVLFPVFWIWMLVDAAFRAESDYAGGANEKVVWLLAMVFFQFISPVYFLVVYRKRSAVRFGTAQPAA